MIIRFKSILSLILILILTGGMVMLFGSCGSEKFSIDYCGQKDFYKGAKDSYRHGQMVVLYYYIIATDTGYSFYLDGKSIKTEYSEKKGFIIRFVMPERNVKLECKSHNSMEYTGPDEEETMLVDYYYAVTGTEISRGYLEMTLYYKSEDEAILKVYNTDSDGEEETVNEYTVPYEAVENCLEIADKYKFDKWDELEDTYPIDGAVTVVKYYNGSEYIRVSTENMPDGGERQLDEIASIMRNYIK